MLKNNIVNQIGSLAIAVALIAVGVIASTQSSKALAMWEKQYKADAIDGCLQASRYSNTKTTNNKDGNQELTTDSYSISWIFDECMKNKDLSYSRTDFSNVGSENK